jgi:hypothetical protein
VQLGGALFVLTPPAQVGTAEVRTTPPLRQVAGRWRAWGEGEWGLDQASRRFREELGLPTDRGLVLTGHQSVIWHPGILAKYIAADQIAAVSGAAVASLVVSHDIEDPDLVAFPVLTSDGGLERRFHRLAGGEGDDRMPARRPATPPTAPRLAVGEAWPIDSVASGLAAMDQALATHAGAESLAAQLAAATADLAQPWVGHAPRFSTLDLAQTTAFAELVQRLEHDPRAAARAYNEAVAASQGHGVAPLLVGDSPAQTELPLWRVDPAGRRQRLVAADLGDCEPGDLVPRALLMTGLVRRFGCDLFIHGTGGAAYDRVTDAWFASWLGIEPAVDLAPDLLVTATLRLPFDRPIVTDADAAAAWQALRRMCHDPAALGEDVLGAQKRDLVARIADLPRHSVARATLFREMHRMLSEVRDRHADRLAEAKAECLDLERAKAERSLLEERTWPFPLYPKAALDELRDELSQRWLGA